MVENPKLSRDESMPDCREVVETADRVSLAPVEGLLPPPPDVWNEVTDAAYEALRDAVLVRYSKFFRPGRYALDCLEPGSSLYGGEMFRCRF